MADVRRLAELGMPTELAKEVASQIDGSGGFTPGPAVEDSEATTIADLRGDFNDLLASLRAAGVISG